MNPDDLKNCSSGSCGGGGELHPVESDGIEGSVRGEGMEMEAETPQEQEEEARPIHAPTIPCTPSLEEVRQHRLSHRPFRSWCPHCIRGKGRENKHTRSTQKDIVPGIPKLVADYFFVGRRRAASREERSKDEDFLFNN